MKKILEEIRQLPPAGQLLALAELIEQLAETFREGATATKAQLIVTSDTRERRGTQRDD